MVVFQRPANENWLNLIKSCQKMGKIIVTDYDDDPFETSPLSPAYRFLGTEEVIYQWPDGRKDMLWQDGQYGFNVEKNIQHRDMFRLNFKKADMITTTTNILADKFKTINKNTVVLPNLMDFGLYPKCEFVKKEIRIGWQGGSSHYEDLYMLLEPLGKILKKHSNVKFIYMGDVRFVGLFKNYPLKQVEIHPWVQNVVYPYKLTTLNLDIGLCPLVDNKFNRSKSSIKYFDYSVVGAATIASNIPPYSLTIEDSALLINDLDWFDAIEKLIKDKKLREKLAKRAYEHVYQEHNADKKAHLWSDAYKKVLKQELVGSV